MSNILIAGVGQLGSRHLQGISKVNGAHSVYLYDSSLASLKNAEERLIEIKTRNPLLNYFYSESLESFPSEFDLVIIATNSDGRSKLLSDIASKFAVKYMLIEKFLFQSENEYEEIQNLFAVKKTEAWVNCARRMYPEYIKLKHELSKTKIKRIEISGNNWGMGSNSIHMIDLIAFLLNSDNYRITNSGLMDEIYKSKRSGYVEYFGNLTGEFKETQFSISCFPGENISLNVIIYTSRGIIKIDQAEQTITKFNSVDGEWTKLIEEMPVHYQSSLTNKFVEDLMNDKEITLTSFNESVKLHLPLLREFLTHYKKITKNNKIESCPIT
ncbi:MAG: hypothetical protein L6Q66_04465 [Bacteroidia bacterium]|nr:hypothetical protein [Bacteroidia bacterium]